MAEWITTTVGEISTLIRGINYNKQQASKASQKNFKPILRANNIDKLLNYDDLVFVPENLIKPEQIIKQGDIIFAMSSGSKHLVGKSARAKFDYDGSYGAFCSLLRPCENVSKDFLYYFFQGNNFRRLISEVAKGSNINNLKREHIIDFEIPLPPLPEQHRIVAKIEALFSELDKGIESLKTAQQQLKIYRQALLKHAFSGKLTEQWRAENQDKLETAEALLQRIQTEREQRYQAQLKEWETNGKQGTKPKAPKVLPLLTDEELAELPELPVGWVYSRLGHLIDEPTYGTSKKCDYETDGIGVLRIPNVVSGEIDASDLKFAQFNDDEIASYKLSAGDILLIRSNGSISIVGRCALVSNHDVKYLYAGYLIMLRPNKQMVLSAHLLNLFSAHSLRKQIEHKAKSTSGVNNINSGEIQSLIFPICGVEEQKEIQTELESRLSITDQLEQTITTALQQSEVLRQSILKKAFSGQLVPQDPNDEPASVLLERIKAEKAALINPIKKGKNHA